MRYKWAWRLLAGAALMGVVGGCAEEREPINRVQSMALKKSFFVGDSLADPMDDPEFYAQQFIIDVPYGVGAGYLWTVGFGGKMSRVRWEITENYIIGRITYERIDDSDGKGVDPANRDGVIAAMFPIISHFDIRRSYNQQTGEEMNVIEENMSDRPWYEREYFRVDWSQNLNTESYDFNILSDLGLFGGTTYKPLTYQVDDPNHPHAPHFSEADGYFDVVTKAFAEPAVIDISHMGWGIDKIPACWLENDFFGGSAPSGSCNPIEITLRLSFRKIVDTDYEPSHWDGYKFSAYGAFYTDRYGYSSNYGMVDDKWKRLINRYNIWERSHYYDDPVAMTGEVACNVAASTPIGADPNRDGDGDGTADECQLVKEKTGMGGSYCDVFKNKCTLPFRLRKEKVTAWYYTSQDEEMNRLYFEPTSWAVQDWDVALRSAVLSARYAECVKTRADGSQPDAANARGVCGQQFPVLTGQQQDNEDAVGLAHEIDLCRARNGYRPDNETNCVAEMDALAAARGIGDNAGVKGVAAFHEMITLCHSPVQEGDHPACGERGLVARLGDLRYHGINIHKLPQTPSPWGIMVDSIDPSTGETIMASANCFAFVNDLWAQGVIDYVRYINGELRTEDITEGTNVRQWIQADNLSRQGGGGIMPQINNEEMVRNLAAIAKVEPSKMREILANEEAFKKSPIFKSIQRAKFNMQSIARSADAPSNQRAVVNARLNAARGSEFEAQLMSAPVLERAGVAGLPLTDVTSDYASPLRMNNPQFELEWEQMKQNALAKRAACIMNEAPEGTGITALAKILPAKFPLAGTDPASVEKRNAAMLDYLRRKAHYAVIVHEIGHSIGLRHNFVSSYDAFGFRPQYWQLRTKNGEVTTPCTELTNDGESCVGPRYYDPITPSEHDQLITMFMQSSVMDYAGTAEGDLIGLGAWDFAAARMFYGGTVAVFAEDDIKLGTGKAAGMLSKMDNFGGIIGMVPSIGTAEGVTEFHYSQYQNNYQLIRDCYTVDPATYRPSDWNDAVFGAWDPVVDGRLVNVNGQWTKCKQIPVDHVFWDQLKIPTTEELGAVPYYRGGGSIDPENRIRVPYGFASDNWADLGNLSVYRHDIGADPYELFQFFISQQETRHIWDNYRRGRQAFSVRGASGRAFERYNAKMRDGAKGLGLLYNIYGDFFAAMGHNGEQLWPFIVGLQAKDNALASGMAFDHFARQLVRPHAGQHYMKIRDEDSNPPDLEDTHGLFVPADDARGSSEGANAYVTIPNGATGYFMDVGIGGRPLNNNLSENNGDYDSDFTINAGSYYDKINAPILFCESVDNFISDSRGDFYDARYRAVSMADLFTDGYRRMMANMLTMDEDIKAVRVVADENGMPLMDGEGYPAHPIGWTMWWPQSGPEVCLPSAGSTVCRTPAQTGGQPCQMDQACGTNGVCEGITAEHPVGQCGYLCQTDDHCSAMQWCDDAALPQEGLGLCRNRGLNPMNFESFARIDSQVGWEQHKHLIAQTLLWLPENQQQKWLEMMRVYELGTDNDPGFGAERIEFHNPISGKTYVAKTYGKETIFGKVVQKGIAARMLEYANELVKQGWVVDCANITNTTSPEYEACVASLAPDLDGDEVPDWPTVMRHPDGTPIIIGDLADPYYEPQTQCDQNKTPKCTQLTCDSSSFCLKLQDYIETLFFMRQAMAAYGLTDMSKKGVY